METTPQPQQQHVQQNYHEAASAIVEQVQSQMQLLPPSRGVTSTRVSKPTTIKNSKIANNINKWNAKSQELSQPVQSRQTQPPQPVQPIVTRGYQPPIQQPLLFDDADIDGEEVVDEDGEDISEILGKLKAKYEVPSGVICLLCKRSLGTTEKLVAHFERSALHSVSSFLSSFFCCTIHSQIFTAIGEPYKSSTRLCF